MRARAFSMIEFAAAMAIAGLIAAAATASFSALMRHLTLTSALTRADDTAKAIIHHYVGRLQQVGGGALRPWDALILEEAPTIAHTELGVPATTRAPRLWFATALPGAQDCAVLAVAANTVTTDLECCQSSFITALPPAHSNSDDLTVPVEVLLLGNGVRVSRTLMRITTNAVTSTCVIDTQPGFLSFGDGDVADIVGGVLQPIKLRVLALNETEHELLEARPKRRRQMDGDVSVYTPDVVVMATNAYAFVPRFGWDINDKNGVEDDEWTTTDEPPGGASRASLRELELAFVVGGPLHDATRGAPIELDGETYHVPGYSLQIAKSRLQLRNLALFD